MKRIADGPFGWRLVYLAVAAPLACVHTLRPPALDEADALAATPSSRNAAQLAPQAHARAEALRREAERAFTEGQPAEAGLLAERSLAAYEHAWVLARLATAEQRRVRAGSKRAADQAELERLQGQLALLRQRAASLEARASAELVLASEASAPPEGLHQRQLLADGARALLAQARVLCACLRLAQPTRDLSSLHMAMDAAATEVAADAAASVGLAAAARAGCESALTQIATEALGASGLRSDQLLTALSRAGLEPSQDARGVSVTLAAEDARWGDRAVDTHSLEVIAQVAGAHPRFALLLVGHAGRGADRARVEAWTKRLRARLEALGVPAIDAVSLGGELPLTSPDLPGAGALNRRVEFVFVPGQGG